MEREAQTLPVRLYHAPHQIVLAAPMPGLEPQDISITIADRVVTIAGNERGPGQHHRDLILAEWRIGPYFREVSLDKAVDGALTNATYGNGVLVVSMPMAKEDKRSSDAVFRLSPIEPTRGERVGHTGSEIRPLSSRRSKKKSTAKKAARE